MNGTTKSTIKKISKVKQFKNGFRPAPVNKKWKNKSTKARKENNSGPLL